MHPSPYADWPRRLGWATQQHFLARANNFHTFMHPLMPHGLNAHQLRSRSHRPCNSAVNRKGVNQSVLPVQLFIGAPPVLTEAIVRGNCLSIIILCLRLYNNTFVSSTLNIIQRPLEMTFWTLERRRDLICIKVRMNQFYQTVDVFCRYLSSS